MQTLFTKFTISMSDFKRNPNKVLQEAGTTPVAVLNHNKPAFYVVNPLVFELFVEQLADDALMPLLQERLAQKAQAIEVDINAI